MRKPELDGVTKHFRVLDFLPKLVLGARARIKREHERSERAICVSVFASICDERPCRERLLVRLLECFRSADPFLRTYMLARHAGSEHTDYRYPPRCPRQARSYEMHKIGRGIFYCKSTPTFLPTRMSRLLVA